MPTIIEDALYLVQRGSFEANGVTRERGEVVDTSDWRNVKPMVDTRYLAPLPKPVEETIECECNRRWIDIDAALRHDCPARVAEPVKE